MIEFLNLSILEKIEYHLMRTQICKCLWIATLLVTLGCGEEGESADVIIHNAVIYTVNQELPYAEALAIKNGRILKVGSDDEVLGYQADLTKMIDAQQNFLMPGFIEGHGHFDGLGSSLINLNFMQVKNWDEVVDMVAERVERAEDGEWIIGRGWHQEKWNKIPDGQVNGYPHHASISAISPDNPVMLSHASGHALFANQAAMDAAGVTVETADPSGGHIVRENTGEAIGVFEENAEDIINSAYEAYLAKISEEEKEEIWHEGIRLAQEECLRKGITSFQDAGSSFKDMERYQRLAEDGNLDLRLWVMLRHHSDTLKKNKASYPLIGAGNGFLTCRAYKVSIDGALGSFGAWLLEPYQDKPGFIGQNTVAPLEVKNLADLAIDRGMQLCVHAIGDRANQIVLDIYEGTFQNNSDKADLRWRIEHAQHLDPKDIPRFSKLGIIASMQGIHCTSDAPFVEKRLGPERARLGAYAWRSLLDNDVIIANGTDAPVEDVDPIPSFYASVTRKRIDNGLEFFPEQRMTRKEAIASYTIGNAYAAFEEDVKGSLEEGKYADIVILSENLETCSEDEILDTKILLTMVNGQIKYRRPKW